MDAAVAARGISERRPGLARVLDEFPEILDRHGGVDRQHPLIRYDRGDRREILEGIGLHLLVQMRVDGDHAVGEQRERGAVRRGLRDQIHRDVAVRARAVFHDHGLAEELGEPLSDDPRRDIGRASRRDRHDQLDRPRGVLRPRSERKQGGERQYRETTHAVLLQGDGASRNGIRTPPARCYDVLPSGETTCSSNIALNG